MKSEYLAHVSENGRVQTLADHLSGTSALAEQFARPFGAGQTAHLAALAHDLGKGSAAFQRRIRGSKERVDHSTAGAQLLLSTGQFEAAFAVAGHHTGLPDGGSRFDGPDASTLMGRSRRKVESCEEWIADMPLPTVPAASRTGFHQAFFTRMLYSCLVDADFLDTEAFMQGPQPRGGGASVETLCKRMRRRADAYLSAPSDKPMDRARNQILRQCIAAGQTEKPGLFTLTVPTGGGKTFSSLAFALEHAISQNLDRIIYVIPYTSIIEQTVDAYQSILGPENVLGHYSTEDILMKDSDDLTTEDYRRVLATENWDAPVIVTTAVQFFESLFSNRSSKCRKLHNIANSVLIFDEAQTLPIDYLYPCLASIAELVQNYHVSAVLCTATQPALGPHFQALAPDLAIREICPDSGSLFSSLRRTTLHTLGPVSTDALAAQLVDQRQVLCVVNRRDTAQKLYELFPPENRYCLTTLLCAADRRQILSEIREKLKQGDPCRVVSTSLIEAGVDIDFPAAFREEAGLDSILQTAGRCNREGLRDPEKSEVFVFSLEEVPPPSMISQPLNALHHTLRRFPDDLQSENAIKDYFTALYHLKGARDLDKKEILKAFERGISGCILPFQQVAQLFHLIDSPAKTLYIPTGEGAALCDQLKDKQYSRSLSRRLGLYSVPVYPKDYTSLYDSGCVEPIDSNTGILTDPSRYDPLLGLSLSPASVDRFIL